MWTTEKKNQVCRATGGKCRSCCRGSRQAWSKHCFILNPSPRYCMKPNSFETYYCLFFFQGGWSKQNCSWGTLLWSFYDCKSSCSCSSSFRLRDCQIWGLQQNTHALWFPGAKTNCLSPLILCILIVNLLRFFGYSLTMPVNFQNEDRTLWEATNVYVEMSPFMSANKIKKPILLIHGEEDNNPGTLTMQVTSLISLERIGSHQVITGLVLSNCIHFTYFV